MTAIDPTAHLTAEQIEELGRELDAIRDEVIASRGEKDAAYIRKVIASQRKLELVSRGILLFSFFYVLINLLIDLAYTFLDPMIRY